MKILALNSSPRANGQSKTEIMLNSLAEGMREAGAEVAVVDLRNKKIKNCAGCFSCWTKTPGSCIHKDDMTQELFPQWLESDEVWMDILTGKSDGQQMFLDQKYTVEGDLALLMQMEQLFGRDS
jgi:hypothetical protein